MELNLEQLVKDRIDEMDLEGMVRTEIRGSIHGDIQRKIQEIVKQEGESIIGTEIKIQLKKGVRKDNGYGDKAEYSTFEDFFRREMGQALKDNWRIESKLKDYIKAEVERIVAANRDAIAKYWANLALGQAKEKARKVVDEGDEEMPF